MRVTHDDGVELTFENIVNDSSLYGRDVLNRIESNRKNLFVSENRIESEYFSEHFRNGLATALTGCALMTAT